VKRIILVISVTSFVLITACAGNLNNVVVEQLAKSNQSWDGESLPEYPKGQPEVTILRITGIKPSAARDCSTYQFRSASLSELEFQQ
jgi:hypothetical protein